MLSKHGGHLDFDQVACLQKLGIAAGYVFAEQEQRILKDVEMGRYNIVFASPESMLSVNRWRRMLTCEVYKKHLIGIAVDEAHCISHWYVVLAFLLLGSMLALSFCFKLLANE